MVEDADKSIKQDEFGYCLDVCGELQYRSIPGHSGVPEVDTTLFTLLEIPYKWKTHICQTGTSNN